MSAINETLKQKIDELDLDRRLNEASVQAEQVLRRALDTAAEYAREHRDDVDRLLARVSSSIRNPSRSRPGLFLYFSVRPSRNSATVAGCG